jgi:hypothetical protein
MVKTREGVFHAADNARPYVDRALHDDELRESLKKAFAAAREVYAELVGRRGMTRVAQRLVTDTDLQENLRVALEELRHAANRLQAKEERRARTTMLLLTGVAVGILFNPWTGPETRRWLMRQVSSGGEPTYDEGENSGLRASPAEV